MTRVGDLGEGRASLNQDGLQLCDLGQTLQDDVAVERIEFDAVAAPPGLMSGNQRRPGPGEGIEDDAPAG